MSEQTTDVQVSAETTQTSHTDLTPFAAAVVATRILRANGKLPNKANGSPGEITPQSMYSNKTIARVPGSKSKEDGGTGILFVGDSFYSWLQAQLKGTATGGRGRVNIDALVDEFSIETVETAQAVLADEDDEIENDEDDVDDEMAELEALTAPEDEKAEEKDAE